MSEQLREQFIALEGQRLKEEHGQVEDELRNLREMMQAEVDVEPDEGDAEIFEREKNAALIVVLERRLSDISAALRSMAKGTYGSILLATKDLDRTFETLQASDAEIVQEPTEQPYGVRDCAVRDPAGNMVRIQELA